MASLCYRPRSGAPRIAKVCTSNVASQMDTLRKHSTGAAISAQEWREILVY